MSFLSAPVSLYDPLSAGLETDRRWVTLAPLHMSRYNRCLLSLNSTIPPDGWLRLGGKPRAQRAGAARWAGGTPRGSAPARAW
jgi:hypothetical protein